MVHLFGQIEVLLVAVVMFLASSWSQPVQESVPSILISSSTTAFVTSVIDGDTIDVKIDGSPDSVRIRYIGIDTPEPYAEGSPQCGSIKASLRNRELVGNKTVTIVPGTDPYDKYGRLLAYVYVDNVFINQSLIAEGYARVLMIEPNTEYNRDFAKLYKIARTAKLGIWSECNN